MTNCNLRGCKAINGGGIRLYKSSGGDATLTVSGGEIGGAGAGEPNTASGTSGNGGGISVEGGSCTVTLKDGAKITGNTANNGGGVYAENIKTFTLKIAEISSNTAMIGGGIYASGNSSVFAMENGTISGNTAEYTGTTTGIAVHGGGVYLRGGVRFTMKGGAIKNNTAFAPTTLTTIASGGGVYIKDSGTTFIMEDGTPEISGNEVKYKTAGMKAELCGGGVYVEDGAEFTMKSGAVKNNKMTTSTAASSSAKGGEVYVQGSGSTFILDGTAEISGNEVKHGDGSPNIPTWGGGVCLESSATFTMKNGTVKENKCLGSSTDKCIGGGVYAASHAQFNFKGGTISGNSAGIGKGVYIQYFTGTAYMTMSGGAKVDSNNDVYLGSAGSNPAFITVTGALSNSPAATLTMDNIAGYAEGREVVKGGVYTLTAEDIARFPITAQISPSAQDWTTELDNVGNQLKLKKKAGATGKTINWNDTNAWTKLKNEVENASGAAQIIIKGTIKATDSAKGEITVSRNVEIVGDGTNAVLDAALENRIFKVNTAGKLTIKNLKLTYGFTSGTNDYGGAIHNEGELTLISCKIIENCTQYAFGGGIYVSAGSVTAEDCTFTGNEAQSGGGAVYVNDGTFKIKGSTTFTVDNGKNDVYLKTGKTISLDDALSGTAPIARITPESYTVGHQVLTGDDLTANCTKFAVTPNGTQEWEIDTAGKLAKKRKTIKNSDTNAWEKLKDAVEKAAAGDVIIIDGEIKATATSKNSGEIKITKKLTIEGKAGASSDILNANSTGSNAPNTKHRIFSVESGGNLTIKNIKLKNGMANNGASGGIIYINNGTVYLHDCTLEAGSAYNGGGIALSNAGGTCTLENTTITGCTANTAAHGGAVAVLGPSEEPNPKCKFIMKNGTNINNEIGKNKNDVYLVSAAFIKLENFTNGTARITPLTYAEGHKVLEGATTAENYKKFTVTPNGSVNWYVGSNGNLTQTQP